MAQLSDRILSPSLQFPYLASPLTLELASKVTQFLECEIFITASTFSPLYLFNITPETTPILDPLSPRSIVNLLPVSSVYTTSAADSLRYSSYGCSDLLAKILKETKPFETKLTIRKILK